MSKGFRGENRPADLIGAASMVGRIATSDTEERTREPSGKVRSELAGAKARAKYMSKEERSAVAYKAADVRWG